MADFRLMPDDEIRSLALESGYEDDENSPAEEKFLNELESTMVELQTQAYKTMSKAQQLSMEAFKVTQMAYSIFEQDKIMEILNTICDETGASDDHRESF